MMTFTRNSAASPQTRPPARAAAVRRAEEGITPTPAATAAAAGWAGFPGCPPQQPQGAPEPPPPAALPP